MLFALGAASSMWDALQSLTSSKSSSAQSGTSSQSAPSPFDLPGASTPAAGSSTPASGATGWSPISPQTMSALISAQSQATAAGATSTSTAPTSPSSALQDLFSQIDGNGDGQISKSEFETALGAGGTNVAQADDVFSKLDKNGDGSVSLDEMKSALQGAGGHHGGHHHAHAASTDDSGSTDPTTGASTTSADPLMQALDDSLNASAKANAAGATPSYNAVEQMIQRGLQSTQAASVNSISVTA